MKDTKVWKYKSDSDVEILDATGDGFGKGEDGGSTDHGEGRINAQRKRLIMTVCGAIFAIAFFVYAIGFSPARNQDEETPKETEGMNQVQTVVQPETSGKEEPKHQHTWVEANYNTPQTCMTCGETTGTAKTVSTRYGLRDIVSSTYASSVYSGDLQGAHTPEKMYDGKLDTNWTENASGNGVGEYVTFYFDGTYAVNQLRIYAGSHYNKDFFARNCRPKVITLTFSDGSSERINLSDTYDEQVITFSKYYYTDSVKLTIEEVYTGTKYLDTVIAELDFAAYRP